MNSIVLELQSELINSGCDIIITLRKAHLIAKKLGLNEFDAWIQNELNGYKCHISELPDYRKIKGMLMAFNPYRGLIPCIIPDKGLEETICTIPFFDSLSAVIEMGKNAKNGMIAFNYRGDLKAQIMRMMNSPIDMDIQLETSVANIRNISEIVKNCLLEWTLKLESEGIRGDNMSFRKDEKENAKNIPQQVNNYYGTVVNGNVEHSQVISGQNHTIEYNETQKALADVKESIEKEDLCTEDKETALALLEDISDKISQKKKPSVIKAVAKTLGEFLMNAGASVAAEIVMARIEGRL